MEAGKRAGLLIGIEIGGTKLQLVQAAAPGQIHRRRKLMVNPARGAAGIREQIEQTLPELSEGSQAAAIGVGFGGPVDWRTGRICVSHQISGWSDFDLAGWLRQMSGGSDVLVDNDANVGALGEAVRGAGKNFNPVFYITLGSGVGGGLVVNGRIFHGAQPGEAEIGHVRLDRDGTTVESRCSGWAIDRRVRNVNSGLLARRSGNSEGGEARLLVEAMTQGDREAERIVRELSRDLGFGLSHVVHLFHPEIIIIGGGLAGLGEPLRAAVERELGGFVMEAFAPGPKIALAALGEDAVPVGALELARRQLGN